MQVPHRIVAVVIALVFTSTLAVAQAPELSATLSATDPHRTADWALIAPHLPDPLHSTPDKLETAGDVLRARRFPDDALVFYRAALLSGGDNSRLLKKQGVLHLELQHGLLARLCFQQAVKLNKRDSEAWNNFGAANFMLGNNTEAVSDYKRAIKFRRSSAIYHSNLSLAYFEVHDAHGARREIARAFELDPEIMHHNNTGGYNLQLLSSTHYAQICVEMARVYAAQGARADAIEWLGKAAERGVDLHAAIGNDAVLAPYLKDEQVLLLMANADGLRGKTLPAGQHAPSLGRATGER